jgi:predicted lipid carrier protein YhbT
MMATVEESRKALERLLARISELDAADRAAHLVDRTLSLRVPDLGVTFVTNLRSDGADPVREAADGEKPAQVRFTANSDTVVSISEDPGSFARAWLTGRLKVQGNVFDLLRLRKLM